LVSERKKERETERERERERERGRERQLQEVVSELAERRDSLSRVAVFARFNQKRRGPDNERCVANVAGSCVLF